MARGGLKTFDGLGAAVGEDSSVDGSEVVASRGGLSRSAPLRDLVDNPDNPRDSLGDLDELASIVEHQLQPVVVVTRAAYQALYPDTAIEARWVVVLGNRRLAAAHKFGRPTLDIVVRDDLARDRGTLLSAIIAENVDRSGFDVIEEAKAVERLVGEYGSADAAAKHLLKSKGWVSQRRALLKLAPALQEATRRGDLAIREARALARVPLERQVSRWTIQQEDAEAADKTGEGADNPVGESGGQADSRQGSAAPHTRQVTRALRKFDADPSGLAIALHAQLGDTGARTLVSQIRKLLK
ncbi:MAG: ParB N-terminal domain-containing protein [Actinomycetia bacterium]|nr:ParB N-terminal domain-containing protein [Actinomycetes bacterium]